MHGQQPIKIIYLHYCLTTQRECLTWKKKKALEFTDSLTNRSTAASTSTVGRLTQPLYLLLCKKQQKYSC